MYTILFLFDIKHSTSDNRVKTKRVPLVLFNIALENVVRYVKIDQEGVKLKDINIEILAYV